MNVTSFLFIAITFVAALVYHRLPDRYRNPWLLLLSAGFIATWNWQFILVLLIFGLFIFGLGILIEKTNRKNLWVFLGVLINLAVLFLFKYSDFYLSPLLHFFQIETSDGLSILLPVGLSFLIVQSISYLVDIKNSRVQAERSLVKFWLYVLYFPKLLSGPVEQARQFLPRLDAPLALNRDLMERSLALLTTGLFRKIFFADSLFRMIPDAAFLTPQNYNGQDLVFWLLGYAFALYNDFVGYTAIVRGISLWFGIELTNNFNLPYLARNFSEFWNRWHISLSNWLRDYIFFPLSRGLMHKFPQRDHFFTLALPPLFTLLASGLWHGLSWNMFMWGGLHGCFLLAERLFGLKKHPKPVNEQSRVQQTLGRVITFLLTVLAWLPFKMSLPVAWKYLISMFHWVLPSRSLLMAYLNGTTSVIAYSPLNIPNPFLILMIALAIGFDYLMKRGENESDLRSFSTGWQIVLLVVIILLILISLFTDSVAPFVYQGF